MGILTDAPIFKSMQGLTADDTLPFGGQPFEIDPPRDSQLQCLHTCPFSEAVIPKMPRGAATASQV